MPNELTTALHAEITRLARKELKRAVEPLRKLLAQQRRDIAQLKRSQADTRKILTVLEGHERKRLKKPVDIELAEGARFSPRWLKSHRTKVGLSQEEYATLVGVHMLTISNWENGKSKPRPIQLASLVAIRNLKKREAQHQLEMLG